MNTSEMEKNIWKNIEKALISEGKQQQDLSKEVGIDLAQRKFRSKNGGMAFNAYELLRLSEVLEVPTLALLTGETDMKRKAGEVFSLIDAESHEDSNAYNQARMFIIQTLPFGRKAPDYVKDAAIKLARALALYVLGDFNSCSTGVLSFDQDEAVRRGIQSLNESVEEELRCGYYLRQYSECLHCESIVAAVHRIAEAWKERSDRDGAVKNFLKVAGSDGPKIIDYLDGLHGSLLYEYDATESGRDDSLLYIENKGGRENESGLTLSEENEVLRHLHILDPDSNEVFSVSIEERELFKRHHIEFRQGRNSDRIAPLKMLIDITGVDLFIKCIGEYCRLEDYDSPKEIKRKLLGGIKDSEYREAVNVALFAGNKDPRRLNAKTLLKGKLSKGDGERVDALFNRLSKEKRIPALKSVFSKICQRKQEEIIGCLIDKAKEHNLYGKQLVLNRIAIHFPSKSRFDELGKSAKPAIFNSFLRKKNKLSYEEPSDSFSDYLSSEYSLSENEIERIMNQLYFEEFQIKEEKRLSRNERAKYLRGLSEGERERERDPRGRRPATKTDL